MDPPREVGSGVERGDCNGEGERKKMK